MWTLETKGEGELSSPLVFSGGVYVGTGTGTAYALRSDNGAKLWQYTINCARMRGGGARWQQALAAILAGPRQFAIEHRWTLPELAGLIRSTSFLPAAVLGDQAGAFDAQLAVRLGPHSDASAFTETVSFFYELAQKPH